MVHGEGSEAATILTDTVQIPGVITECVDVADLDAVKKAVELVAPIHLLVNNAAVAQLQHFLDVTPEAYDR